MPNTRDDLSIAYRTFVKSQGGKAALDILKKVAGVDSVDEVADDKIDAAIKALKAVKAPSKSLSDIHSALADIGSKLSEKKNEHRT